MVSVTDPEKVRVRFQTALALFDLAQRMMTQNLRRKHPAATEAEIEAHVRAWLQRRPGAEHGDADGSPIEWPTQR
jgi:hypothetical protein